MAKSNPSTLEFLNARLRPLMIALPVVGALFAGVSTASATTYTYTKYTVTNQENLTITGPGLVHPESGGMGQINLYNGSDYVISVWCVDIYTYLANADTFSQGQLTTSGSGGANPGLSTNQIQKIGTLINHATPSLLSGDSNASAAIQLAIWMTEYPTFAFHDYGGSGIAALANTLTLANTYIGYLGSTWSLISASDVQLLTSLGGDAANQQQAFVMIGTGNIATPLPAAWTMMVGGLSGFGFLARRSRKKKAAARAAA